MKLKCPKPIGSSAVLTTEPDCDIKMASLRPDPKPACKKCGYPGHLTFECRNTISLGNATTSVNAAAVVLDVSSTSSDSSDDDDDLHTPLTKLRAEELKEKLKKRRYDSRMRFQFMCSIAQRWGLKAFKVSF